MKKALKRMFRFLMPVRVAGMREQRKFERLRGRPSHLQWEWCAPCPKKRAEANGVKIGNEFFLIGGYETLDHVHSVIDIFDLEKRKWKDRIAMPPEVPQTHFGIASDHQRCIYMVAGQLGPRCYPCVADCFVLDVRTKSWSTLPPLPEPRYSPTIQLWRGRLHAISGAQRDRGTPAHEHWSIAVEEGNALESRWREEVPIPKGGPHRASAVCDDRLYLFGGQDGDVRPAVHDPDYTCDFAGTPLETLYGDSFVLDDEGGLWQNVSPIPAARTHSESEVTIDHYAVLVGGNEGRYRLSDLIQVYDARADCWRTAGLTPFCMKTTSVYHKGWLYVVTGQRCRSPDDLRPDEILNTVWRAKFDPALTGS